jgi:fibronectin type 3 domain-containing protein
MLEKKIVHFFAAKPIRKNLIVLLSVLLGIVSFGVNASASSNYYGTFSTAPTIQSFQLYEPTNDAFSEFILYDANGNTIYDSGPGTFRNNTWYNLPAAKTVKYYKVLNYIRFTYAQVSTGNDGSGTVTKESSESSTPPYISPAPTNLQAVASSHQVALSWTATGAAYYNVYQDGFLIASPTTDSFTVTGLANGELHNFKVSSVNGMGESTASVVSATPTETIPPTVPTGLIATPGANTVSLTWNASTDNDSIKGYNIFQDGVKINSSLVTSTSFTVSGLTNGTMYSFTVSSMDPSSNESAQSAVATATPEAPVSAPNAPLNLTSTGGNADVELSWTASDGATSYNIKRSTTSGGPYTQVVSSVTSTTYSDTSVTNGTTYYYVVTAVNSGGESANSNEASATPTAPVPPSSDRALLDITLTGGLEREYDLSMSEVDTFISWYEAKQAGTGPATYAIDKHNNNLGPYKSRKDYVIFNQIVTFEVNEYLPNQ